MAESEKSFEFSDAETIEAPKAALGSTTGRLRAAARKQVALVTGSAPQLTSETQELLRGRLRTAAVLLLTGFGAFYVWSLVAEPPKAELGNELRIIFYSHTAVMVALGLVAWRLCAACQLSMTTLRVAEAVVFGAPALFFVLLNYEKFRICATLPDGHAHVPIVAGSWQLLIFCYALFVPNTWKRAAVVIGSIAVAPLLVSLYVDATFEPFHQLMISEDFNGMLTEQTMVMALTALIAVVGVHTINTLRTQAFQARQLGQYRLKHLLGSGGMGEVYLGEHQMMKRPCAIKIIRPEKAGDPRVLARFEREVRETSKLSHWNSIDIYDYGRTEDGTFYYVMEFLPGHNLGELVENFGPLPTERSVHLMTQVCDALTEAHGMGLVHRDIKPANIYCAYRGGVYDVAKLLDFGLVKPSNDAVDTSLTQEGAITGSPLFMSPEQATQGDAVDTRSDIYSLGALMYYMATGEPPFVSDSAMKVIVAHASQDPEPPRLRNPKLPEELEEIILRCMEKDPNHRFQTAAELARELRRVPVEDEWTSESAAEWWTQFGCPKRKAMAAEALELAAV